MNGSPSPACERLLLCTDLDRTLIPNGAHPESPQARQAFRVLAACPEVLLVFVSGRDRALIESAMSNYRLPRPALAVADVGSSIYDLRDSDWRPVDAWRDRIGGDWRGHDGSSLASFLAPIRTLRAQERRKQGRYKLSYYVPLHAHRPSLEQAIFQRLDEHRVTASLIWSVDEPAGVGLLDVVPPTATKLHAVRFVCDLLDMPLSGTVYAGDSGNDLPVLISDIPSVLVANAMPEVAREATAGAAREGNTDALYVARGGALGMNGNYSAGILEGVLHYHPVYRGMFDKLDTASDMQRGQ
jgi:HAD superfamily hydrolase (TIGR01484 family)